jgi:glucokinase
MADKWHLLGDIGGTNARFGICDDQKDQYQLIGSYEVAAFPTFNNVLEQLQSDLVKGGLSMSDAGQSCLAVAGPPDVQPVSFTNSAWRFDRKLVMTALGLQSVQIINDFAAAARALPLLSESDLEKVGGGRAEPGAPCVALGPGTGLGVATLATTHTGDPLVISGEGGHVDFAPVTNVEAAVLDFLRARYGRVSIERLCCGEGINNIYQALAYHRNLKIKYNTAAEIGAAALTADDALSRETMAMFFAVLGAAAGNFALTLGAKGGIFLAGGIVPRYLDLLRRSDFRARFLAKGRFADYLSDIPTFVVTHSQLGLLGAAASLNDPLLRG